MVIVNRHRETAIVIRQGSHFVWIVRMRAGPLSVERVCEDAFAAEWRQLDYPEARALDRFILHAKRHGASKEALTGLRKLRASA
jgi:hypothetical protein